MAQLKIDIENGTCSPGTTIGGIVQLRGHHAIEALSLSISVLGRCEVYHIWGQGAVLDGYLIINIDKDLIEGSATVGPGESWNFEFKLPSLCTPQLVPELTPGIRATMSAVSTARPPFHKKGPAPRFSDELLQSFPPTFVSSNVFAGAKIEYGLEATLLLEGRAQLPKLIKAWKNLDFTVRRSLDDPFPQTSFMSGAALDWTEPQLEGRQVIPLYFKHKHRSAHTVSFLELDYPTVGIAGQTLRLMLSVRDDLKTDWIPHATFLRRISIKLITMTNVKCLSMVDSSQKQFLIGKDKHLKKTIEGQVDIGNLLSLKLPVDVLPTFATPNVSRIHCLSFKVSIGSDLYRKPSTFHFHSGELILLPQ